MWLRWDRSYCCQENTNNESSRRHTSLRSQTRISNKYLLIIFAVFSRICSHLFQIHTASVCLFVCVYVSKTHANPRQINKKQNAQVHACMMFVNEWMLLFCSNEYFEINDSPNWANNEKLEITKSTHFIKPISYCEMTSSKVMVWCGDGF